MPVLKKSMSILTKALQHEGGLRQLFGKSIKVLGRDGLSGILIRIRHLIIVGTQHQPLVEEITYPEWIEKKEPKCSLDLSQISNKPLISIVCPVYNPTPDQFRAAIASVQAQQYTHWELCLADDCSTNFDLEAFLGDYDDPRIKNTLRAENGNISLATNSAVAIAEGEYVAFMDQDDVLSGDALLWLVQAINEHPQWQLIYSDEDKLDLDGNRCDPHFKPDWNYEYFLNCNYLCHLSLYESELLISLGGCREGLEGAQDYDLALRAAETLAPNAIGHIPHILYHWRKSPGSTSQDALAKPFAIEAGERAITEHLARTNTAATVTTDFIRYRVHYQVQNPAPCVTIVIPSRNAKELLRSCIDSIFDKTHYPDYRILVVDNGSDDPDALTYLEQLDRQSNAEVIRDPRAFNFSALINLGIRAANTEFVCAMNNDIEIISTDWLKEMISVIQQPDVGIVGAKLLYPDDTVQHGGCILGINGVAGHAHKYFSADSHGYADRLIARQELSAVTGACLLTTRSLFDAVDGFDEQHLAVAFNDIDFCLEAGKKGFKIVWTPHAKMYHHESKSRGSEDTEAKVKRFNQEVDWMKSKWGDVLLHDPHYNSNLSLSHEGFSLAIDPRHNQILEQADSRHIK
jgi:GT2 family glycosyltransferase